MCVTCFSDQYESLRIPWLEEFVYPTGGPDVTIVLQGVVRNRGYDAASLQVLHRSFCYDVQDLTEDWLDPNDLITGRTYMDPEKFGRSVNVSIQEKEVTVLLPDVEVRPAKVECFSEFDTDPEREPSYPAPCTRITLGPILSQENRIFRMRFSLRGIAEPAGRGSYRFPVYGPGLVVGDIRRKNMQALLRMRDNMLAMRDIPKYGRWLAEASSHNAKAGRYMVDFVYGHDRAFVVEQGSELENLRVSMKEFGLSRPAEDLTLIQFTSEDPDFKIRLIGLTCGAGE